ncbi:MAG: PHP domain-containing protein [Clostridia bacterium]|nr:PHP domain-containing protein [Clostridia bacterium]
MISPIFADYHTHTVYSHGKGTVEENILAAIECGLCTIAIADHGPGQLAHGVKLSKIRAQIEEIARLKEKYKHKIQVLASLEADITGLDGTLDLPDSWQEKFDLVLGGYHRTAIPRKKSDLFRLQIPGLIAPDRVSQNMTSAVVHAIEGGRLFMVTHPGEYIPVDMQQVARAAALHDVYIEINNKHPMAQADLKIAAAQGVKFLLSSDAHHPKNVGRVDRALDAAMQAGIDKSRIVNLKKE